MGANNSFKQLAEEEENKYPHPPPATEQGIMGNVRVFDFMSNVLELYLPKIFEMFITMVGGDSKQEEKSAPNHPASDETDDTSLGTPK